jgi:hypothetical protein
MTFKKERPGFNNRRGKVAQTVQFASLRQLAYSGTGANSTVCATFAARLVRPDHSLRIATTGSTFVALRAGR